jgi:hypothetical protein
VLGNVDAHALLLAWKPTRRPQNTKKHTMKTGKEIAKEVRKLTTREAQQAYINALTEQEAVAFAVYLLR